MEETKRGRTARSNRQAAQVKVFALRVPTFATARDFVLANPCALELTR